MDDDNLLLLLGHDFRINWPAWKKELRVSLARWRSKFLTDLAKLIILGLCVWGGYVVLLYYLQSVWSIFVETPMGKIFATQVSPEVVVAITAVLEMKLTQFAFACVINTLLVMVLIGVLLKFSGLYRLTYLNRGFVGHLFWGIICTAASAELLPLVESAASLKGNAVMYFLPTICLMAGSFALSAWLVPEFTVFFEFVEFIRERVQIIKIRNQPYNRQEI